MKKRKTLKLPQSAIDYANFHVYDPGGLKAWHDEVGKPIEFALCAWVIGEKSVDAVLKHLGDFYALLTVLQDEGYALESIVQQGGTFRLVKRVLKKREKEEREYDHGGEAG